MSKCHPNHRLIKSHRSYSVNEVAALLLVDPYTVRAWINRGLPVVVRERPMLIHGADLIAFLKTERGKKKCVLQPGEIYCVCCRAARNPAGDVAEYEFSTPTLGRLAGRCPICKSRIYRRVNPANVDSIRGNLNIMLAKVPTE